MCWIYILLTTGLKFLGCIKVSVCMRTHWYNFIRLNFLSCHRDKYRFYACMMRARFDENKNEKDMVKATMMLKAGEEEFWDNQHPQPYIFPDSPGGTSYERYECYKVRQDNNKIIWEKQKCMTNKCVYVENDWCLSSSVKETFSWCQYNQKRNQ